jgi:ADP-heptose:LPS heptosyltransferase
VPLLKALKAARPGAHITFMVAKPLAELFLGQPFWDEVITWTNDLCPVNAASFKAFGLGCAVCRGSAEGRAGF